YQSWIGWWRRSAFAPGDHQLQGNDILAAQHFDDDLIARPLAADLAPHLFRVADLLALKLGDHIILFETRFLGRRSVRALCDAAVLALAIELQAEIWTTRPSTSPWPTAPDLRFGQSVPGLSIGIHGNMEVRRDWVADAAVNANDSALHVEQGSARIAAHECA